MLTKNQSYWDVPMTISKSMAGTRICFAAAIFFLASVREVHGKNAKMFGVFLFLHYLCIMIQIVERERMTFPIELK